MDQNAVQVYVLLISRLAAGFFGATIGAAQAYIADVTKPEERGRGMALIGAAFGIGFTIGPAIGGISAGWHRYAPGFIAAGLSLFAFVMAAFALPEPQQHRARAEKSLFDLTVLRSALATPTIPLILGLQFAATFAFASFESTLSLLTQKQWHYDERHNGYVFTFIGFVLVLAQGGIVRRYMPKVGELRFVVAGCALMAIGLLGVAYAGGLGMLLAALAVAVLGFAMVTPSLSSLLSRRTPQETQGEVLGVGQSMLSLARIFGPIAGNLLFGVAWTLPQVVAANLLLISFLGALVLARLPAPESASPPPSG
jgi:MFS family permease